MTSDKFTCVSMYGCLKLSDDVIVFTSSRSWRVLPVDTLLIGEYLSVRDGDANHLAYYDIFSSRSLNSRQVSC